MGKRTYTYKDLQAFIGEIELGANNTNRTIEDVENLVVKSILLKEVKAADDAGITAALLAPGAATTVAMIGAWSPGTAAGMLGGAGIGAATTGIAVPGTAAIAALDLQGAIGVGAATGATTGSSVPVIGTIIGAAVGAGIGGIGIFVTSRILKREHAKKIALMQDALRKDERRIRALEKEAMDLENDLVKEKAKGKAKDRKIERLKYLLALRMGAEEIKHICEA